MELNDIFQQFVGCEINVGKMTTTVEKQGTTKTTTSRFIDENTCLTTRQLFNIARQKDIEATIFVPAETAGLTNGAEKASSRTRGADKEIVFVVAQSQSGQPVLADYIIKKR